MFADNKDVQFADSNLADGGPRGGEGANPGAGGWPTIRYYNKETGVLGKSYEKKTDMAMCSELGPEGDTYLQQYVEEAANTSLCSVEPPYTGCGEKAIKFIEKMNAAGAEKVAAESTRLAKMKGQKMKDVQKAWLSARLAILKQLSRDKSEL